VTAGRIAFRVQGATSAGHVREQNEDCFLVDPELRFYAVFDGMGGHNAGDVASRLARDVVHEYMTTRRGARPPRQLLERAMQKASGAIHEESRRRRELHGMGTTVVACQMVDEHRAVIAHVGDSRAYLLRDGRLRLLTRDHTVVSELLARNAISAEDAVHHPYKSVLSRNLGGKPTARADIIDVELALGDRLLLCSDGLTGYASHDAIEQVLGGAEEPVRATADLIELALRGGGGDNVTAVVIEAGQAEVPRTTQILRESGASAWWQRRRRFLEEARARGVARSPICAVLSEDEAIQIVAGNLAEAVFHDLEQSSGIHVWTFAENLANGWLDQSGSYEVLRRLLDDLRGCAEVILAEIASSGEPFALGLEVAVLRALIVAEMALAGVVAERTRAIEAELVRHDMDHTVPPTFSDEKTIPFMGAMGVDPCSPDVGACLDAALGAARAELVRRQADPLAVDAVVAAHQAAVDFGGESDMLQPARDLYGVRVLGETAVSPLFDVLEQAREVHLEAIRAIPSEPGLMAPAFRRASAAHQSLAHAVAVLVADACQPIGDALRRVAEDTAALRAEVGRGELEIAELERRLGSMRGRGAPGARLS
jgi:serine/threonine protein phosphatase PrpC